MQLRIIYLLELSHVNFYTCTNTKKEIGLFVECFSENKGAKFVCCYVLFHLCNYFHANVIGGTREEK